ncbi:MAG TPA: phage tail sheath C-terminal domain-containing protein [Polyangia bacterium]|nr:phage tail sheath C-terminal domain-containing protein [Polyangia bacterium]
MNSFGDYVRAFGGLDADSSVSYAVSAFFQNGGGQAVIVRLYQAPAQSPPIDGAARVLIGGNPSVDAFTLRAASPGTWANDISVTVSVLDPTFALVPATSPPGQPQAADAQLAAIATILGLDNTQDPTTYQDNLETIFSLTITHAGTSETIANLTLGPGTRQASQVLKAGKSESQFVVWDSGITDAGTKITTVVPEITSSPPVASFPFQVSQNGVASDFLSSDTYAGTVDNAGNKSGILALDNTDIFNVLCIPPDKRSAADPVSWGDTAPEVFVQALPYVVGRRAMLIIDPPTSEGASDNPSVPAFNTAADGTAVLNGFAGIGVNGNNARNAVMYFPRVLQADTLNGNRIGTFTSNGIIAGIWAATDAARGVWKAPAGIDAGLSGIAGLATTMTDAENGEINPIGINALRTFPIVGTVVWGARTMRGSDVVADDYKYLPVRRFALFLEESLFRGLKFAVFEPNAEPLWSQIRLNVNAFLNGLFRQGAFAGATPRDAYFVKCDSETTTQNDINLGVVNVLVGFAPLKPAEFVIIQIQQIAGQVTT